jgi:hypothetical protein
MKKSFTLFLCLGWLISIQAGTFRVNNKLENNPSAKIYSDLQAAHDAAYNGDTIMIEGSADNYSYLNCSKRLVIKGPGYFLDENPGISANKISAKVNGIDCQNGSDGTIIMGLDLESYGIIIYDDNITVRRCHTNYVSINSNIENITVSECFFYENYNYDINGYIVTNLLILNCIINDGIYLTEGSTGAFLNNVINPSNGYITIPTGFDIKNNILYYSSTENISLPLLPDPDIAYNISTGNQFGTANHNQANVAESELFLGALTESTDGKWQLAEGSPAIGTGEGGVDCGAFGGPQPYVLSGPPTGPVIYELQVSSYSTDDNKLPVTIKVKSY